jgi:hypothetical protein
MNMVARDFFDGWKQAVQDNNQELATFWAIELALVLEDGDTPNWFEREKASFIAWCDEHGVEA